METISSWVDDAIARTPVYDIHTHLYPPDFGNFMLWGIDELLTYHYLVAETIRLDPVSYDAFWKMGKREQADLIWKTLFLDHAPISEACRGVLTVLKKLGLDTAAKDLRGYRDWFSRQKPEEYINKVFDLANVRTAIMTNEVFDPVERDLWLKKPAKHPRLQAVLRVDRLLLDWPNVGQAVRDLGFKTGDDFGEASLKEIRRFLSEWIDRMKPIYIAVSLGPEWRYRDGSASTKVLDGALLPVARERNLPFAMMIGVRRAANPQLRVAGDTVEHADVRSVHEICSQNQKNKFLCTMLARENQHELAVAARKHRNLLVFGCWWFLNNPSLIEEITRMRMELLGESFIPQHSDCRVLDQAIYKWDHSRTIIAKVLKDKFNDLAATGWKVTQDEVNRCVKNYFGGAFEQFLATNV